MTAFFLPHGRVLALSSCRPSTPTHTLVQVEELFAHADAEGPDLFTDLADIKCKTTPELESKKFPGSFLNMNDL